MILPFTGVVVYLFCYYTATPTGELTEWVVVNVVTTTKRHRRAYYRELTTEEADNAGLPALSAPAAAFATWAAQGVGDSAAAEGADGAGGYADEGGSKAGDEAADRGGDEAADRGGDVAATPAPPADVDLGGVKAVGDAAN